MSDLATTMLVTAGSLAALMVAAWLLSLRLRDVSIVDSVWGLGFVLVAWISCALGGGDMGRRLLIALLVSVWGLRLAAHITLRKLREPGEDYRYARMRERHGSSFPVRSLGTIFGLQGALVWVVSLPLQGGANGGGSLGAVDVAGTALWAIGLAFEAIGDWQLARFRADPASSGRVMDRGLWRYTRHPNYFGDLTVWWGLYLIAVAGGAWWSIVGPLVMSMLLIRVSGKALLERSLRKRRPGYDEYVARTSGFFPLPPRGSAPRPGPMQSSRNIVEHTLLAWAFERPPEPARVDAGARRVGQHYGALLAEPPAQSERRLSASGIVLWWRQDRRLRWPLWAEEGGVAIASTGVPTGWASLVGELDAERAAIPLAHALLSEPARAAEMNPPFAIAAVDGERRRIVIVNDFLGAGRLYQLRFDGGAVWSNRLGALPLFAGTSPRADERAWRVFAAAGWFLGEATPIEGAVKVRPASAIEIADGEAGARVEVRESGARGELVAPRPVGPLRRGRQIRTSAEAAAARAESLARETASAWSVPLAISLTGGRDSRVSAAAALAAGIDATYNTGDQVPGELDTVRELIAAAPREMPHTVNRPEPEAEPDDDLLERAAAIHLVHDGMRNPQELRRQTVLPHSAELPPTLSGHGGELGHGFYYGRRQKLRRIERAGEAGPMIQLERNARARHSAAIDTAYAEYLAECERTLDEGRAFGLEGPALLDWYYMAQRLPYRSGLGARSGRSSACVTPAFVRGAFDLRPGTGSTPPCIGR